MLFELVEPAFPFLKYAVPSAAIGLVVAFSALGTRPVPLVRGVMAAMLAGLALLAAADWNQNTWRNSDLINSYEFYHYYLPTKYAQELGYTNLYAATIVAQKELKHRFIPTTVRDLESSRTVSTQSILNTPEKYKAPFSEERWEEFKKDVHFFRMDFKSDSGWQKMMNDKGYNGTPVWTMVGGFLSNSFSTESKANINFLALIDWFYFLIAVACVAWAFGPRTALLLACLMLTHYVAFHGTLKSAFMRLDWVMCLIMSVAFIKKGYFGVAGTLTAYAALSRVFPAVFVFGVGAHALWQLWDERRISANYWRHFIAFASTCAILLLASLAYNGVEYWREFIEKITAHSDDLSAWRVGLKYVFLMGYEMPKPGELSFAQRLEEYGLLYRGMQALLLCVCLVLARRVQTWQAYTLGFAVSFILVAPTYYYYIMLGVPFLFFAATLERPAYALGAIHMYVISMLGHYWLGLWNRGYTMFFWLSVAIAGAIVWMWVLSAWEWYRYSKDNAADSGDRPLGDESMEQKTTKRKEHVEKRPLHAPE